MMKLSHYFVTVRHERPIKVSSIEANDAGNSNEGEDQNRDTVTSTNERLKMEGEQDVIDNKQPEAGTNATKQVEQRIKSAFDSRASEDLARILELKIVDIAVIFPKDGESIPKGYKMINKTPYDTPADLSNGILTGGGVYLCVQFDSSIEGSNKLPICDVTLVHMEKEQCPDGYTLVKESVGGKVANVNRASGNRQVFVAYKRIPLNVDEDERYHSLCPLADLCVLNISKKQKPPLGFTLVDKSTTVGNWTGSVMKLAFRRTKPVGMLDSTFSCTVADRFPKIDKPGSFPLPPMISMFTAPYGLKFERRLSTDVPLPKFFTFVLTTEVGEKVHGACLSFYEELDEEDELQLEESYDDHINNLARQLGELNPKNGPLYRAIELYKQKERSKVRKLTHMGSSEVLVGIGSSNSSVRSSISDRKSSFSIFSPSARSQVRRPSFFGTKRQSSSSPHNLRSNNFVEQSQNEQIPISIEGLMDPNSAEENPSDYSDNSPSGLIGKGSYQAQSVTSKHPLLKRGSKSSILSSQDGKERKSKSNDDVAVDEVELAAVQSDDKEHKDRASSKSSKLSDVDTSQNSIKSTGPKTKIYAPTSICILSSWPFYGNFKQFLNVLYQISLSPSNIPVENVIGSFISNIPQPIPGGPVISLRFGHGVVSVTPIKFSLPKELSLPMCEADFETVFRHLSPDHFVQVFTLMLLERKVLIHSKHRSLLNQVAECLRALMFPLDWRNVYVPVCPERLFPIIEAPMAFLMGVDSDWVINAPLPEGIWLVSIDNDTVYCSSRLEPIESETGAKPVYVPISKLKPGQHTRNSSLGTSPRLNSSQSIGSENMDDSMNESELNEQMIELPAPVKRELIERLNNAVNKHQIRAKEIHQVNEDPDVAYIMAVRSDDDMNELNTTSHSFADLVRDAGLRTMISLIGNYRRYLLLPSAKVGDEDKAQFSGLFDVQGFLTSVPKTHRPFLEEMVKSQSFSSFIEECGNAYEKNHAQKLLFFDLAIQADTVAVEAKEAQKAAEPSVSATLSQSSTASPPLSIKSSFKGLRKSFFLRSSSNAANQSSSNSPLPPTSASSTQLTATSPILQKESALHAATNILNAQAALVTSTNHDDSQIIDSPYSQKKRSSPFLLASMLSKVGERRKSGTSESIFSFEAPLIADLVDAMSQLPVNLIRTPLKKDPNNSQMLSPAYQPFNANLNSSFSSTTSSSSSKSLNTSNIKAYLSHSSTRSDNADTTSELNASAFNVIEPTPTVSSSSRNSSKNKLEPAVIEVDIAKKMNEIYDYPYDLSEFQFDGGIFRYRSFSSPLPVGPHEPLAQMMDSVPITDLMKQVVYKYSKFPILDEALMNSFADATENKKKSKKSKQKQTNNKNYEGKEDDGEQPHQLHYHQGEVDEKKYQSQHSISQERRTPTPTSRGVNKSFWSASNKPSPSSKLQPVQFFGEGADKRDKSSATTESEGVHSSTGSVAAMATSGDGNTSAPNPPLSKIKLKRAVTAAVPEIEGSPLLDQTSKTHHHHLLSGRREAGLKRPLELYLDVESHQEPSASSLSSSAEPSPPNDKNGDDNDEKSSKNSESPKIKPTLSDSRTKEEESFGTFESPKRLMKTSTRMKDSGSGSRHIRSPSADEIRRYDRPTSNSLQDGMFSFSIGTGGNRVKASATDLGNFPIGTNYAEFSGQARRDSEQRTKRGSFEGSISSDTTSNIVFVALATATASTSITNLTITKDRPIFKRDKWKSQQIDINNPENNDKLSIRKQYLQKLQDKTKLNDDKSSTNDEDDSGSSSGDSEPDSERMRNIENLMKVAWAATRTPEEIVSEALSLRIVYEAKDKTPTKWIMELMSHLLGAWFLCIPVLISATRSPQVTLIQTMTVYRGSVKQNISIDEACYRALIISCGDCGPLYATDAERFLSTLIATKKAQPNAITFTQYTRSVTKALIDTHRLFQLTSDGPILDSRTLPRRRVRILRRFMKAKTMVSVFIALLRTYRTIIDYSIDELNKLIDDPIIPKRINDDDNDQNWENRSQEEEDNKEEDGKEGYTIEENEKRLKLAASNRGSMFSNSTQHDTIDNSSQSNQGDVDIESARLQSEELNKMADIDDNYVDDEEDDDDAHINEDDYKQEDDDDDDNDDDYNSETTDISVLRRRRNKLVKFAERIQVLSQPVADRKNPGMNPCEGEADINRIDLPTPDSIVVLFNKNICTICNHEILDEEIMASWNADYLRSDIIGNNDNSLTSHAMTNAISTMNCPICGDLLSIKLRYQVVGRKEGCYGTISGDDPTSGTVDFLNIPYLRTRLEDIVNEYGPTGIYRESLRKRFPDIYWNMIWFINRVKLPLPLFDKFMKEQEQPLLSSTSTSSTSSSSTSSLANERRYSKETILIGWDGHSLVKRANEIFQSLDDTYDVSNAPECFYPSLQNGRVQNMRAQFGAFSSEFSKHEHDLNAYEPMESLWGNSLAIEQIRAVEERRIEKHVREGIPTGPAPNIAYQIQLGKDSHPIAILSIILSLVLHKRMEEALVLFLRVRLVSNDGRKSGWEVFAGSAYRELYALSKVSVYDLGPTPSFTFDGVLHRVINKIKTLDEEDHNIDEDEYHHDETTMMIKSLHLSSLICQGDYPPTPLATSFRKIFTPLYP